MSKYKPEDIFRAARKVLPDAPEELRQKVLPLLERGKASETTHNLVLKYLTDDPEIRARFRHALTEREESFLARDYGGLGGSVHATPGEIYVCPKGDYRYEIAEAGEYPGECPTHHVPLEPESQGEGG